MEQVILAAGKGTRLNSKISNKCFTKIFGKTLLDYNLELGVELGVSKIILVVGYNADYIINYLGEIYNGIPINYVYQEPQLGISHAILVASSYITDDFLMCLSDEFLVKDKIKDMKKTFEGMTCDCLCGMVYDTNENIQKAYTMDFGPNNRITQLIEKPEVTFNNFKGTGYCMMSLTMLDCLNRLTPNTKRKEYEMGNWIQLAISENLYCYGYEIADANFNINSVDDYKAALKKMGGTK